MFFPVVNAPKVENQHTDVQHGTPQTSPCLHFFGVHTGLSCDHFTFRYSCNPCALQALLHSRLQTPIGKTEVIKKRRTSFVLVHRFPSAIRSGSQRLPPFVPTCSGNGGCLSPFSRRFVAHPPSRQRLAVCLRVGCCFQATCFLTSEINYEFIKFLCNGAINQMTCSPRRNGAVSISTVCQTRKFPHIVYLRWFRHHLRHGTCTRLQPTA